MMKSFLLGLALVATTAQSSVVAIIDSGVDYKHEALVKNMWKNSVEIRNRQDDDNNGLVDDIYGWNFAENNNLVIDYKYLGTFSDDPYKFFEIQGHSFEGTITQEERDWINAKKEDPNFMKEMQKFGNFVHGTHVAGIAAKDNKDAKVMAIKLIPTEVSPFIANAKDGGQDVGIAVLKIMLEKLAQAQMEQLKTITTYVGNMKADIANGSFGTSYSQLINMLTQMAPNTDPAILEDLVKHFLKNLIDNGFKMIAAAPNTLFVFAAGNDGTDNDLYATSPANVKASNSLSVAATFGRGKLAVFSNYGAKMVDVAAPGVIIESAIPGDEYLKVSGTSQAAPYVANVAAKVKDANPSLTAEEIKRIILSTTDLKDYLIGKVASAGVANLDRAIYAAKLSVNYSLNYSIQQSRVMISDVVTPKALPACEDADSFVLPLPSTINF